MEIIVVLIAAYLLAPLGLLLIVIGAVLVIRQRRQGSLPKESYGWPGFMLVLGVIAAILGTMAFVGLSNTNFGL